MDAPGPPSFEQMANDIDSDPQELALMRGVRNRDDYEEAQRNIAAFRAQRAEEADKARREQFKKR